MSDNKEFSQDVLQSIKKLTADLNRTIRIMEVCGTHTVSLRKAGIHSILPSRIELISGPGCPVCVTPTAYIDNAIKLIEEFDALIVTFGDMLKIPGTEGKSLSDYSGAGMVKIVYSPQEAIGLARERKGPVVFLGIGFETTIPVIISPFKTVIEEKIDNLFLYTAFKTVPQALLTLLADPEIVVDGFLLPGHVSVIIGEKGYEFLAGKMPSAIAGFTAADMLYGIYKIIRQLHEGENKVENAYPRVVTAEGNKKARALIEAYLESEDALWRGFGTIKGSGLQLKEQYSSIDAKKVFSLPDLYDSDPKGCLCGQVVQGKRSPYDCPFMGTKCTPENPVGPCMVSSEGSCAAYFKYRGIEV